MREPPWIFNGGLILLRRFSRTRADFNCPECERRGPTSSSAGVLFHTHVPVFTIKKTIAGRRMMRCRSGRFGFYRGRSQPTLTAVHPICTGGSRCLVVSIFAAG